MTTCIFHFNLEIKEKTKDSGNIVVVVGKTENVIEKGEVEATKEGEKEKDEKNDPKDKEKDVSNEQEVVFIQDMGFTVKIVSPGAEPFDIQVSSMELVQVGEKVYAQFD